MRKFQLASLASAVAISAWIIAPSLAVAADESSEQNSPLSEIIVTAQKRTERLQDVPVPVTSISADELTENNLTRIQDYYSSVPGLSIGTDGLRPGLTTISIRGITTGAFSNPTVGITVDDVPYGASTLQGGGIYAPDIDPSDLARVEVLRLRNLVIPTLRSAFGQNLPRLRHVGSPSTETTRS